MSAYFEGLLRRAVWLWTERPRAVAASALVVAVAAGAAAALVLARRSPAPALDASSRRDLRAAIDGATRRATRAGALQPLATAEVVRVVDSGLHFVVTVVHDAAAAAKPKPNAAVLTSAARGAAARAADAFARVPAALRVGTLAGRVVVLNRFPVVPGHVVVTTASFEPQSGVLSHDDLAAMWHLVSTLGGVAFFNAGPLSGASQPRRHTQHVPPAAGADDVPLPVDAAIAAARAATGYAAPPGAPLRLPAYPFPHEVCMLGGDIGAAGDGEAARRLRAWYVAALRRLGVDNVESAAASQPAAGTRSAGPPPPPPPPPSDSGAAAPPAQPLDSHNVLLTRRWMMVVPRAAAAWDGVPVNALGYGGMLLARAGRPLDALVAAGPVRALTACAPWGGAADV